MRRARPMTGETGTHGLAGPKVRANGSDSRRGANGLIVAATFQVLAWFCQDDPREALWVLAGRLRRRPRGGRAARRRSGIRETPSFLQLRDSDDGRGRG